MADGSRAERDVSRWGSCSASTRVAIDRRLRYTLDMSKRFLGRSGEKRFSLLCSEAGVTCNPAVEDEHGWDHVVEFPHSPAAGVPADMQHRTPAVFVQTKSHEADGLNISMKLSNAMSLARSPNPCFVALATLPAVGGASWHVVHVWKELIERILRRGREESASGTPEENFHKKTFSFTMSEADARDDGNLLPWIERTIRARGPHYAAAKAALVPPPDIVGRITVGPLDSVEQLIDHTIGLTPNIPLQGIELGASRLGVNIPFPIPLAGATVFHASFHAHTSATADIRMRGPDGTLIEVQADVIVPPDLGLPEASYKYRFRGAFVDIVWSASGSATIGGHFHGQERMTPDELESTLRFASWAGQGDIDVRVTIEDRPSLGALPRMDPLPDRSDLSILAELAGPLARVSSHLRATRPAISIAELAAEARFAELFHLFLTATDMRVDLELNPEALLPELVAGLAFGIIQVGDWVFAAIQRFPVTTRHGEEDNLSILFGKPLMMEQYAFRADDVGMLDRMREDYRRLASMPGTLPLDNALAALLAKQEEAAA